VNVGDQAMAAGRRRAPQPAIEKVQIKSFCNRLPADRSADKAGTADK